MKRLAFALGIIALAGAAAVLVIVFRADVTRLIPFYAIGVFTSFSLSQAGMAKRHLRLREPGWKLGLVINGAGAVATAVVLVVISITKFAEGAWAVMVLVPVLVWLLMRMNHQYERERDELEEDLQSYAAIPRDRPMALLLVRDLDPRTIHALQYAKTLRTETLAVHLEDRCQALRHVQPGRDAAVLHCGDKRDRVRPDPYRFGQLRQRQPLGEAPFANQASERVRRRLGGPSPAARVGRRIVPLVFRMHLFIIHLFI